MGSYSQSTNSMISNFITVLVLSICNAQERDECNVSVRGDLYRFSSTHRNDLKIRNINLKNSDQNCNLLVSLPNNESVVFELTSGVSMYERMTNAAKINLQRRGRSITLQVTNLLDNHDVRHGRFMIGEEQVFSIGTPRGTPTKFTQETMTKCKEQEIEGNVSPDPSFLVCLDYNEKKGVANKGLNKPDDLDVDVEKGKLFFRGTTSGEHMKKLSCVINKNAYRLVYRLKFRVSCFENSNP